MQMIKASIATPKTDAALRAKFRKLGYRAKRNNVKKDECPYDGMIKGWWLEGWDGEYPGDIIAN